MSVNDKRKILFHFSADYFVSVTLDWSNSKYSLVVPKFIYCKYDEIGDNDSKTACLKDE